MLATHQHIQKALFDGGNVVQHLKQMISSRFSVQNVPDGFLFFPVELGGLDLKSPFVGLLQIRGSFDKDPETLMETYKEEEHDDYQVSQRVYDRGEVKHKSFMAEHSNAVPKDADTFFTFEEFTRYRENYRALGKADLRDTYTKLLQHPREISIEGSPQIHQALQQLSPYSNLRGIYSNWGGMEPYWRWIAQMYGPEMVLKFGGMSIIDQGLLPIGMVGFFRERRTKWQG